MNKGTAICRPREAYPRKDWREKSKSERVAINRSRRITKIPQ